VILGYKSGDEGLTECYHFVTKEKDERSRSKCSRPRVQLAESHGDSRQSKRKRPSTSEFGGQLFLHGLPLDMKNQSY